MVATEDIEDVPVAIPTVPPPVLPDQYAQLGEFMMRILSTTSPRMWAFPRSGGRQ